MSKIGAELEPRIAAILEALEPKLKGLAGASPDFVRDQIKRHDEYGENMFLSPKQKSWLESLYEKNIGPLSELPDVKEDDTSKDYDADDDEPKKDDFDDGIPF